LDAQSEGVVHETAADAPPSPAGGDHDLVDLAGGMIVGAPPPWITGQKAHNLALQFRHEEPLGAGGIKPFEVIEGIVVAVFGILFQATISLEVQGDELFKLIFADVTYMQPL
jgi:hypothetical protein